MDYSFLVKSNQHTMTQTRSRIKEFLENTNAKHNKHKPSLIEYHKYQYYTIYIQNRYLFGTVYDLHEFIMRIWVISS